MKKILFSILMMISMLANAQVEIQKTFVDNTLGKTTSTSAILQKMKGKYNISDNMNEVLAGASAYHTLQEGSTTILMFSKINLGGYHWDAMAYYLYDKSLLYEARLIMNKSTKSAADKQYEQIRESLERKYGEPVDSIKDGIRNGLLWEGDNNASAELILDIANDDNILDGYIISINYSDDETYKKVISAIEDEL